MKDRPQTHHLDIPDKKILQRQNVLFDANSLINIIDYDAYDLLEKLRVDYKVTFATIHPVLVELYNSNNSPLRAQRQLLIDRYEFVVMPLDKNNFDHARKIQVWDSKVDCFPAPTDLYLGSILYQYSRSAEKVLLLTGDLKDFPRPLFVRTGHIVLLSEKSSLLLTLLSINIQELNI